MLNRGNLTTRIVWSLMIEVAIFVVTVILAMVDSSAWPAAFFWITMISVLLMNGNYLIIEISYHSRFIPEGVAEASQIFLRDAQVLRIGV
jgi:hypothetical protein